MADTDNSVIRKITANGNATTFAGTEGAPDKVIGAVGTGKFKYPEGVTADASCNLYVADTENHSIRKTNTSGVISDVSGGRVQGDANGSIGNATYRYPRRLDLDSFGNIYVMETSRGRIRKITMTTSPATVANFPSPVSTTVGGVNLDANNNLFIVDQSGHAIRKIT